MIIPTRKSNLIRVTKVQHEQKRACARRLRQAAKGQIKLSRIVGRISLPNGTEKVVWNE